jgi:hypothetical protein
MNILENLNERLLLIDGKPCYGGEDGIRQVIQSSPISLPDDYIEFLKEISGEENFGIEIKVIIPNAENGERSLSLYSAQFALCKYKEYKEDSAPLYDDIIDKIWLVGDDLGDLLYFYGEGKDGFGLYVAEAGSLFLENADKIADTLTDFLVKGIGIDTAIWN